LALSTDSQLLCPTLPVVDAFFRPNPRSIKKNQKFYGYEAPVCADTIEIALAHSRGNKPMAARLLGLPGGPSTVILSRAVMSNSPKRIHGMPRNHIRPTRAYNQKTMPLASGHVYWRWA
jgi:hypothetical protein